MMRRRRGNPRTRRWQSAAATIPTVAVITVVLGLTGACDRNGEADEGSSAERATAEPEPAVEGARADRPDEGKPDPSKLSESEVLQRCGEDCSGTFCVGERLCDCLSVDGVCRVSGCRDHPTCPKGDQGG